MKLFRFLIFIILVLFPFGELTKIPLGLPGVSFYLHDLVIGLLLILWILNHLFKKRLLPEACLTRPILAFIAIAFFSWLINIRRFNFSELLLSFLYLLRWSAYSGLYFVVYEVVKASLVEREKGKAGLLMLLTMTGVTTAVFGLIQYSLYPNLRNLDYLGWDPHQYRIFGTFLDPGFLGIILVLTLILLVCFKTLRGNWRLGAGLMVFLALVLTYSRSSYLALTTAVVVLAWFKKSAKLLLIPLFLIVFMAILTILPRPAGEGVRLERQSTVQARLVNWSQAFKIIGNQPVFGVGFNSLRFVKRDYGFLGMSWQEVHSGAGLDSSLLFVWATTGVFGLMVYLWLWREAIKKPKIKYLRKAKNFYPCLLASVAALFVHSFFLNSLFYPWVMIWIWVLLGLAHGEIN